MPPGCSSVHPQTILFQAAQRIVEELAEAGTAGEEGRKRRIFDLQSRHALFPQVFRVVEEYVRRKVDFNGAPEPELGLKKCAQQVVERVRDAIEPDEASREPPLLPLLNRTQETGSTSGVEFRTRRPVFAMAASHVGMSSRTQAHGSKAPPSAWSRQGRLGWSASMLGTRDWA